MLFVSAVLTVGEILCSCSCYLIMGWSDDPSFVLMPVVPFTQLLSVEQILHNLKQCDVKTKKLHHRLR